MRILVALAAAAVFGTLWVLDTTALVRLALYCLTGGCGVPPVWIALAGGMLALALVLALRRPRASPKATKGAKPRASRPSRAKTPALAKTPARKKSKPAR